MYNPIHYGDVAYSCHGSAHPQADAIYVPTPRFDTETVPDAIQQVRGMPAGLIQHIFFAKNIHFILQVRKIYVRLW